MSATRRSCARASTATGTAPSDDFRTAEATLAGCPGDHLAIVVDEFGGTEGIITMEDLVEEILSGTEPREGSEFYIEPLGNGKFLVSGNARLDDLTEHLGFQIDAEGIDTIGGFVTCPLPERNWRFRALRLQCVALAVRESKKYYWKKPRTFSRRQHDGGDRHHYLLLDHFVFL